MFQLTKEEFERLKSQIVISSRKIEALEKKYDEQFAEVFAAIKEFIAARATTTQNRLTEYDFSRGVRGKYARRYARGSDVVVPSVPITT